MKISQREARRLKKRVAELEALREKERSSWVREYPGGVHLGSWTPAEWLFASIKTARRLGFPVVVATHDTENNIHFYVAKGA